MNNKDIETKRKHFDLLNKLFAEKNLSVEDATKLCSLIITENPYTYHDHPDFDVQESIVENHQKARAYFDPENKKIYVFKRILSYFVPESLFTILTVCGHEMKHYYQHMNLEKYAYKIDEYSKNKGRYDLFYEKMVKLDVNFITNKYQNDIYYFNKIIQLTQSSDNKYMQKLARNEKLNRFVRAGTYYTFLHEYDARLSGIYFAYGMIKSYMNDPLIEEYPMLKKQMNAIYKFSNGKFKKIVDKEIKLLENKYDVVHSKLEKFLENLKEFAIDAKLPCDDHSLAYFISYYLTINYKNEDIKNIILANAKINPKLTEAMIDVSLKTCPTENFKDLKEFIYQNILADNIKMYPMETFTDEQNTNIINTMIDTNNYLYLSNIFRDKRFQHLLTPDVIDKMTTNTLEYLNCDDISIFIVNNFVNGLFPYLNDDNKIKLDDKIKNYFSKEFNKEQDTFNK